MKIARTNLPGRAVPVQLNGLGNSILTDEFARFLDINKPFGSLNALTTGLVTCVQNSGEFYRLIVEKRTVQLEYGNPEKRSTILIEEEEDNESVDERYSVTVTSNQPDANKSKIPEGWKSLDDEEKQDKTTEPFLRLKKEIEHLTDSSSYLTKAVVEAWGLVISDVQSNVINKIIALELPVCMSEENKTYIKCSGTDDAKYHLIYDQTHGLFIAVYGHEFTCSNAGFGSGHMWYWEIIEKTLERKVEYNKDVLDPTCILMKVEKDGCYPVIAVLNEGEITFTKTKFPPKQIDLMESEISYLESSLYANEIEVVVEGKDITTLRCSSSDLI